MSINELDKQILISQANWYRSIKPNYELRLFSNDDYFSIEVRIDEKNEIHDLIYYAQFVLNNPTSFVESLIRDKPMETEVGTYLDTFPETMVLIEPNDVTNFNFRSWSICTLDNDTLVAKGTGESMEYIDIGDPFVGKYAMVKALKQ